MKVKFMDSEIYLMIDSYVDGELDRNDEDKLFEHLAVNPEARDYLRKLNLVNNQMHLSAVEFPSKLERNILNRISRKFTPRVHHIAGLTGYISAGISIILIIISLLLLTRISDYRDEIKSALNQVQKQNSMIEALYYSYPAAEVHAQFSNEIIVKSNI